MTKPKTRFPRAQHDQKYDTNNTWERTSPSQPAVFGRDTETAGSRGTDGPLFGRSGVACSGRLSQVVVGCEDRHQAKPHRSRPRTDVGTPEHERATISRQHKPHQLREVIGTGTWNTRTMRTIGKVEIVESEMHRMKIGCLGLAETRWSGKDDCHGRMFNGDLLWIRKS